MTTNGTPAPFTASITPVSGGTWASVTRSSGTTPLTANPTGLASGSYEANLIIQGPINTLTAPVGLVIAPSTVVVAPTSLAFTLAPGATYFLPPQILQVQVANPIETFSVSTQSRGQLAHRGSRAIRVRTGDRKRGEPWTGRLSRYDNHRCYRAD